MSSKSAIKTLSIKKNIADLMPFVKKQALKNSLNLSDKLLKKISSFQVSQFENIGEIIN
jgi:hypothetical protein